MAFSQAKQGIIGSTAILSAIVSELLINYYKISYPWFLECKSEAFPCGDNDSYFIHERDFQNTSIFKDGS